MTEPKDPGEPGAVVVRHPTKAYVTRDGRTIEVVPDGPFLTRWELVEGRHWLRNARSLEGGIAMARGLLAGWAS